MHTSDHRPVLASLAVLLLVSCGDSGRGGAPAGGPAAEAEAEANGAHTHDLRTFGRDLDHAVEIAPNVYQARGTGNAHVIATPGGRVVFDTGLPSESDDPAMVTLAEPKPDPIMALFGASVPEGLEYASKRTPRGYAVEFAIPASSLDAARGAPWDELRINVGLADFDENEPDHTVVQWRANRFGGRAPEGSGVFVRR